MGKLTNTAVKSALNSVGRHADGDGLYLVVRSVGRGAWVARVQKDGRRRDIGLGPHPAVGLALAREKAAEVRAHIIAGRDPVVEKRKAAGIPTFEEAARLVHEERRRGWRNGKHVDQWINTLRDHVFPAIGGTRLDRITMGDVISAVSAVWQANPETGSRVLQRTRAVLDWGFALGYRPAETPIRTIMQGLPKRTQPVKHHAAMPFTAVPSFMATLNGHVNMSRLALGLLILTAARSGEVRGATWEEFDLDDAVWTIPAARMKMKKEHVVPLAPAAIAILTIARTYRSPASEFIFPGLVKGKPLSDMALTAFLRKEGLPYTVHGFRSSFRDWVSEKTDFSGQIAEMALAHTIANKSEASYRRGNLLEKRRGMMEAWAAYVIPAAATYHV